MVEDALFAFSENDPRVRVTKYTNLNRMQYLDKIELEELPVDNYLSVFAITVYHGRYILLTGGRSDTDKGRPFQ